MIYITCVMSVCFPRWFSHANPVYPCSKPPAASPRPWRAWFASCERSWNTKRRNPWPPKKGAPKAPDSSSKVKSWLTKMWCFFTTAVSSVSRDSEKLQLTNVDLDFTKFGIFGGAVCKVTPETQSSLISATFWRAQPVVEPLRFDPNWPSNMVKNRGWTVNRV